MTIDPRIRLSTALALLSFSACTGTLTRKEGPGAPAAAEVAIPPAAAPVPAPAAEPALAPPAEAAARDRDPWESVNRRIFWFNDRLDVYVLAPTATGWTKVAPECVRRSIANFFFNLRFPIITTNDLLQGRLADGATDVGRFAVNTTVGVFGFFDPASRWGLERHDQDFGQTLAVWGMPPGPYLVLPIFGPSNPRDTLGLLGDYPLAVTPFFVNQFILLGARTADIVNTRSFYLAEVRDAKAASLDYYVFVRNAYLQRRTARVTGRKEMTSEEQEDLYHPELDHRE